MALFKGSKEAPPAAEGEATAECMRVGQALVEAGQITAENMRFELQDAGSPTVVRDPKDEQSLYVLMPMRV